MVLHCALAGTKPNETEVTGTVPEAIMLLEHLQIALTVRPLSRSVFEVDRRLGLR
jgi:hypothetical protein